MESPQELKQRWVEALRSGRYQQGRGYLRKDGKYCCLGVLCDVVDSTGWDGDTFNERFSLLPYELKQRLNISNAVEDKLTDMNDSGDYTFNEIADWIEVLVTT